MGTEPYPLFRLVWLSSSQLYSEQVSPTPKSSASPIAFSLNTRLFQYSLQPYLQQQPTQRHNCGYSREQGEICPSST